MASKFAQFADFILPVCSSAVTRILHQKCTSICDFQTKNSKIFWEWAWRKSWLLYAEEQQKTEATWQNGLYATHGLLRPAL